MRRSTLPEGAARSDAAASVARRRDAAEPEVVDCARCGRPTAVEHLAHWTERQRLRCEAPTPGGFAYVHRVQHYAVCPACYGRLARGGEVADARRRRAVVVLVATILVAAVVAALTPIAMPDLMAAFWQVR